MADGAQGPSDILFSGTYTNGINLNNPATQNPATIAALGLVANTGTALYGGSEAAWTVANYGTVTGSGTSGAGIILKSGGLVENGATGLIVGYRSVRSLDGTEIIGNGIEISGTYPTAGTGTVVNNGTVKGGVRLAFSSGYYGGYATGSSGVVINSGEITGGGTGVYVNAGDGTILNHGIITGTLSGAGISLGYEDTAAPKGTIINFGTIGGGKYSVGSAAYLINYGQLNGGISAPGLFGGVGVLSNYGTIDSAASGVAASTLVNSGMIVATGTSAPSYGISGSVLNSGTIENTAGNGVSLNSFPTVYLANSQTGLIEGATAGVAARDVAFSASQTTIPSGTVINYGTIIGSIGVETTLSGYGTLNTLASGTTIADTGTIIGTGGASVYLGSSADLLAVAPGAVFQGAVIGSGSTLELAAGYGPGKLNGFGIKFTGFTTTYVDPGAVWRLAGAGPAHRIVNDGTIAVTGTVITQGRLVSDAGYSGLVAIEADGVARFNGAVSAGETIAFTGMGGTAALTRPPGFAGTISDFGAGDAIDLVNTAADGLSLGNGQLTVTNQGTMVADLTIAGHDAAASFALSSDTRGGTEITLAADPAPLLAMKG